MAQLQIDQTRQESDPTYLAKLNSMFGELYSVIGGGLNQGSKVASALAGAATLNQRSGVITSESLTTAAAGLYTLTLTDNQVAATDNVQASVALGTSTTGTPQIVSVSPAAGSLVIIVKNIHASAAFNGTIKIAFMDFKP